MAQEYRIGPAFLFITDDPSKAIVDWVNLGKTRGNVVVTVLAGRISVGKTDQDGNTPLAAATFLTGTPVEVTFPMIDSDIDKVKHVIPGSVVVTNSGNSAAPAGRGVARITPVFVALIPVDEYGDASPTFFPSAVWFRQGVVYISEGGFVMNLPEGDDNLEPIARTVIARSLTNSDPDSYGGIGLDLEDFL